MEKTLAMGWSSRALHCRVTVTVTVTVNFFNQRAWLLLLHADKAPGARLSAGHRIV